MIRLAKMNDIEQVMSIVKSVLKEMKEIENYQWDENYPKRDVFLNDISNSNLYVYELEENIIGGFICIDFNEPDEYKDVKWGSTEKSVVIHRMAVSSIHRGTGIAIKLLSFAEKVCIDLKVKYIHTDTYSSNKAMNKLFKKMGYMFVGTMNVTERPLDFNCYERKVNNEK